MSNLISYYSWFKVFHLFSVFAWIAGIFYFPRLLVYHAKVPVGSNRAGMLETMERRLMHIIMIPSMILSLTSGALIIILFDMIHLKMGWFHLKALCVAFLLLFQYMLNYWRVCLLEGKNTRSPKFFVVVNELPSLALIVILICVVVKPF